MCRFAYAAAAVGLATLLLAPAPAAANGRYPQTATVSFQPGNDQRIFVGATWGLLISDDDGATWRWTCEENVGYSGEFDPIYTVSSQGTIFASTFNGLAISRDGGCSFDYAGAPLAAHWIGDVHVAENGDVWATTTSTGKANDIYVSDDDGMTFTSTGLLDDLAWWKSVRTAPGDPDRVYAAGYLLDDASIDGGDGIPTPLLRRSDDGGQNWTEIPFDYEGESQLYILGVSPIDANVVYARVDGALKDTLLLSQDGAMSWSPVLTFDGDGADIVGFVITDDGMDLIAGTVAFGTRVSHDGGMTWGPPAVELKMSCLGLREADGELFACGANWSPDRMAIARSTDAGEHWDKVMRFIEVDDELTCPPASEHGQMCSPLWMGVACQFGIGKPDAGPTPADGGAGAADAGNGGGGKDCGGCGVGAGWLAMALVWPLGRRRRRAS